MANESGQQGGGMPNPVQIQKFLGDMKYPAKKQDILDMAKRKGADQKVLDALGMIPDDMYENPAEISKAIGKMM